MYNRDISSSLLRKLHTLLLIGLCSSTIAIQFHIGRRSNISSLLNADSEVLSKEQWFTQRLDHFSPSDTRTWSQRYYVNENFFDPKNPGPVFLLVGDESELDAGWMIGGAWIEYAKTFKALCVSLEHRYYGESHPTEDVSVANLKYLSSQQALADIANFIAAVNNQYKFNDSVKWVAFGGSYGGSLAAWLRLKYPRSVHAAVSSSAPILAKLNFEEYFKVVIDILNKTSEGEKCVEVVKTAHRQIAELFEKNPSELDSKFRLCKSLVIATKEDVSNFYNTLATLFAEAVQDDKNLFCSALTQRTEIREYERFLSLILDASTCFEYDYTVINNEFRNTKWSDVYTKSGERQWCYQTCAEFAYFLTSSGEPEAFGNDFKVDFYVQTCQDILGAQFTWDFIQKGVDNTNKVYGGLDISVDRVVFVQGSDDPWSALGMRKTRHEGAPVIYINGTGHIADLLPSDPGDSQALRAARVKVVQYLEKWLRK